MKFLKVVWGQVDDFILELGRIVLLGAYSSAFALVTDKFNGVTGDWEIVAVMGFGVLKAIDRYLHEKGLAEKGITRF